MNMADLDKINHKSLEQEFVTFQLNIEKDSLRTFEFYLDGFLLKNRFEK